MAHTTYLPSDITSKALRDTYYKVQQLLTEKYDRDLVAAKDKDTRRTIVENFNTTLRNTINYYVGLSNETQHTAQ